MGPHIVNMSSKNYITPDSTAPKLQPTNTLFNLSTPGQFFGWVGFGLVVSIVMSHPTLHKKDQLSIYQIRFPSLV
jgi:hypothetical protein